MQPAELFEFVGEVLKSVSPTVIDPERFDDLETIENRSGVHKSYALQPPALGHIAFFRLDFTNGLPRWAAFGLVNGEWLHETAAMTGTFTIELLGNSKVFYVFDPIEDEEKDKIKSKIFDGVLELLDPWMLTDSKATNPRPLNKGKNDNETT